MDVVSVVTPLVREVAQVLHGDQIVELSGQLEVQDVEGKEEDREGQVEVEEEKVECCSWSHACLHCSCHCCSFCRRVSVASFLY